MTKIIAAIVAIVGAWIAALTMKVESQEKDIHDAKEGELKAQDSALSDSQLNSAIAKDLGRDTTKP